MSFLRSCEPFVLFSFQSSRPLLSIMMLNTSPLSFLPPTYIFLSPVLILSGQLVLQLFFLPGLLQQPPDQLLSVQSVWIHCCTVVKAVFQNTNLMQLSPWLPVALRRKFQVTFLVPEALPSPDLFSCSTLPHSSLLTLPTLVLSCFLACPVVLSQCICTYSPHFLNGLVSAFHLANVYIVFRPHVSRYFLRVPFLAFLTRLNPPSTCALNMTYLTFVAFSAVKNLHVNTR